MFEVHKWFKEYYTLLDMILQPIWEYSSWKFISYLLWNLKTSRIKQPIYFLLSIESSSRRFCQYDSSVNEYYIGRFLDTFFDVSIWVILFHLLNIALMTLLSALYKFLVLERLFLKFSVLFRNDDFLADTSDSQWLRLLEIFSLNHIEHLHIVSSTRDISRLNLSQSKR